MTDAGPAGEVPAGRKVVPLYFGARRDAPFDLLDDFLEKFADCALCRIRKMTEALLGPGALSEICGAGHADQTMDAEVPS